MKNAKTCDYCGEPITGRNDKRYCSSSCKSRDFRERGGAGTTVVIQQLATPNGQRAEPTSLIVPAIPPTAPPLIPPAPVKRLEDEVQEVISTVVARREKEALDAEYIRLVERFLEREGELLSVTVLRKLNSDSTELVIRYRAHPLVKQGDELHRRRLDDLYVVTDATSEALTDTVRQIHWKEPRGAYELSNKLRRKMRERLIG